MHLYFIVIVWIQHALVLYRINDSEFFDLWRTDGRTDTDTGQLASIAARGLKKTAAAATLGTGYLHEQIVERRHPPRERKVEWRSRTVQSWWNRAQTTTWDNW